MQLFVFLYGRSGFSCITTTVSLLQPAVQMVLENESVCNFFMKQVYWGCEIQFWRFLVPDVCLKDCLSLALLVATVIRNCNKIRKHQSTVEVDSPSPHLGTLQAMHGSSYSSLWESIRNSWPNKKALMQWTFINFFILTKYVLVQKGHTTFWKLSRFEIHCASDLGVGCYHPKFFTLRKAIVEDAVKIGWMTWWEISFTWLVSAGHAQHTGTAAGKSCSYSPVSMVFRNTKISGTKSVFACNPIQVLLMKKGLKVADLKRQQKIFSFLQGKYRGTFSSSQYKCKVVGEQWGEWAWLVNRSFLTAFHCFPVPFNILICSWNLHSSRN